MHSIFRLIAILPLLTTGISLAEANEQEPTTKNISPVNTEFSVGTEKSTDTDQPMFQFGGFGTLATTHSSQKLGDYVIDGTVPKGAGRSANWDWNSDSRLGIQASANIIQNVSAVIQVISEYNSDGTYRPGIEWANVKYEFIPDAYIRVGRIALPTFLNSNNRKVGYSYPWIHPPVDVYRQRAITNSDGVDAMYRFGAGRAENAIKIIYGMNTIDSPTTTVDSRDIQGITNTLEFSSATFRVGYEKRKFKSRNLQTGIIGPWTSSSDLTVGASYDPGKYFVISEWIQRKSTTKIDAMYIGGGYRLNDVTSFMTYSQNSPGSPLQSFIATPANIQTSRNAQKTVSLGMRWFFMKNTDLKFQYDQIHLSADSNGNLINVPAGNTLYGSRFHLISAAIDFVF
jgi:predicted porin